MLLAATATVMMVSSFGSPTPLAVVVVVVVVVSHNPSLRGDATPGSDDADRDIFERVEG